jgi:hypothetical protein
MKKGPTKAEKKAIIDKHPTVTASEAFTEEQWSRLMWATHSEVREVMREVSEENAKEGKGLLGQLRSQDVNEQD